MRWALPVTKQRRVTHNLSLGPIGSFFCDAFTINGATYDKSSSNLVGFILNRGIVLNPLQVMVLPFLLSFQESFSYSKPPSKFFFSFDFLP